MKELGAKAKADPKCEQAMRLNQLRAMYKVKGVLDAVARNRLRDFDEQEDLN